MNLGARTLIGCLSIHSSVGGPNTPHTYATSSTRSSSACRTTTVEFFPPPWTDCARGWVRNDIAHKRGICTDSAKNTLIAWLEPGKPIALTTRQMIDLFDKFPHDELHRAPSRVTRSTTDTLPYAFPNEWIDKVRTHIETIEPARKKRPDVLRRLIDDWMNDTTETDTSA